MPKSQSMKYLLFLLFTATLINACNNPSTDSSDNLPEKEKNLKESITNHPDSFLLKEKLIQYYRESGNFGQAISETKKFISSDSTNDRLWDIIATLYFENGDTTLSIQSFERAIDIKAHPEYILSLGSLYAQTKNPLALAMADALMIAKKANAEYQALFIKGLYYSYNNEKEKAINYFDQSIAYNYTNMLAYREKAICLYDLGKYVEGLKTLEKAVTLQNSFEEGYYWMGRCYEKMGETAAAIESYKTALEFAPDYIEAKDALSKLGVKN